MQAFEIISAKKFIFYILYAKSRRKLPQFIYNRLYSILILE